MRNIKARLGNVECFHVAFLPLFGSLALAEMAGLPENSLRGHQSLLRQAPGWSQRQLLVLILFDIFLWISVAGRWWGDVSVALVRLKALGRKKGSACRKPNKMNELYTVYIYI